MILKIELFLVVSLHKKMPSISLLSFEKLEERNLRNLDLFVRENLNIGLDYKGGECIVAMRDMKFLVGVGYAFEGELKCLCVDKEYRRIGVGKKIVNKLLDSNNELIVQVPIYEELSGSNGFELLIYSDSLPFYEKNFKVFKISNNIYKISPK